MTYLEKFKDSKNYGIFQAQQMLKYYEKECIKYFDKSCNKHVNLMKISQFDLSDDMKKEKAKALKNIDYLKNIVDGRYVNPVYTAYFDKLRNNEYPAWRK